MGSFTVNRKKMFVSRAKTTSEGQTRALFKSRLTPLAVSLPNPGSRYG